MADLPGYYSLFPRGAGASTGPMPEGYVMVSRWIDAAEAKAWMANGGTYVPPQLGAGGRLYVTLFGASRPSGTGPIRIDFGMPERALQVAGRSDWRQIIQPVASTPVYNVTIQVPNSIPPAKICPGDKSGPPPVPPVTPPPVGGLGRAARGIVSNQAAMALAGQIIGDAIQSLGDYGIQLRVRKELETTHAQAVASILGHGQGVLVIVRLEEWDTPDFNGMRARGLLGVSVQGGPTESAALSQWRDTPRLLAGAAGGWRAREEYAWIPPQTFAP